jgi:uncharacterized phiE125 gp8 family phage protein
MAAHRALLRAAMAAVEARTGKILIEREFSWTLTAWSIAVSSASLARQRCRWRDDHGYQRG